MSEEINGTPDAVHTTHTRPGRNGHAAHIHTDDPLPGINLRELVEERNWTALAGLALVGIGILYLFGAMIDIDINLWAIALLGMGGWLAFDGWQTYQAAGQHWVESSRNRVMGGGLLALIGLLGTLHLNWWGLLLLSAGSWLAYDTWQKAQRAGLQWSDRRDSRNRMFVAGAIGLVGLLGLVNLGGAWSWLLVLAGGFMIYRHWRGQRVG